MTVQPSHPRPGTPARICYVADTERDAVMLRFQVDAPVLVRARTGAGEGTRTSQTPGASEMSETSDGQAL